MILNFIRQRIYKTTEGKILLIGITLCILYCLLLLSIYVYQSEQAISKISFSTARLLIGNPAGVLLGYAMGFDQRFVILANLYIDTVVIFILYPLLIFAFKELLNTALIDSLKKKIFKAAEEQHTMVERYGHLGLFLFVLFPLWGTGPVVGSIIGFFMKIKPWLIMFIVISATYIKTVIYSFIFKDINELSISIISKVPLMALLIIFSIIAISSIVYFLKLRKKDKNVNKMDTMAICYKTGRKKT